jgi:hypothetical protein
VIVSQGPSALVLMHVDVHPEEIKTRDRLRNSIVHFDRRWVDHLPHIDINSPLDLSSGGHRALALLSAMRHAKANGKRIVYLSAVSTAVAYYLNYSFGDGVHAFVLGDEDTFEVTRRFALSPGHSARDYANVEAAMENASTQTVAHIVGFVLDGKDALAALDYSRLVGGAPPTTKREWLGQSATFWPVARDSPLVVGRTYDVVLALEKKRQEK